MRNDSKHVALEKIRDTINLLRKSNLGHNSSQREDSLLNRLKSLQNVLRYDQRDIIDPFLVVDPFLAILRAPYLAGPFKLVALDALQTFTSCNLFSEVPDSGGSTLAKVVDAVTGCKFVQTDAMGDELVQLQIIHTLSNIIRSPVSCYLIDETAWDIISACHSVLIHIAATGSVKSIVYQAAEKTILDASRLVFASAGQSVAQDLNGISNSNSDSLPEESYTQGPSCACAVKVLKFFVGILQKFCTEGKGGVTGVAPAKRSAALSSQASSGSSGMGSTSARHSSPLGFGESVSPETRELLFAVKAVHAVFLAEGDLHGSRSLIANHEPLASLVRDDLGRCLILLCSRRDLPPTVLQSCMGLFSLTVQLMGPTCRILVECFMKFIYIKAILQVRVMFAAHDESMRLIKESQATKEIALGGSSSPLALSSAPTAFSVEELEIILESLADLLADLGFLPALFNSFDCDPSKGDIVQPLVKYLSSCMRYTLVCEPAELGLGGLKEIGALVEQCYGQLSITLNRRDSLKTASSLQEGLQVAVSRRASKTGRSNSTQSNDVSFAPPQVDFAQRQEDLNKLAVKLRLTRLAKGVLAEAALKFSNKPQEGLKFLQARGVLPSPLTPASVAKFLRIAPGLPNECTGSFLGELGKDNPSYEADGKAFHREVLLCYVRSFELKGQTVLNCMRIFLSAFRLPGEAQQIDRILVAFSEYCHGGSIEGNSGLLENPEVTYLLTFSMIMLNTDLHNPNVRADRKMTIAQFIKNNSFYGEELNQTRIIPKDYLEAVYESLAQVPLRTERNDLNASITPEMWMDLQLQATINTEKGLMLSTSYSPLMIHNMTKRGDGRAAECVGETDEIAYTTEVKSAPVTAIDEIASVARCLLTERSSPDEVGTLALCAHFSGLHWLADRDFLSCVYQDFFGVAICPFVMHRHVVAPTASTVAPKATSVSYASGHGHGQGEEATAGAVESSHWRTRHSSVRALSVSIELTLLLLALLHSNEMQTPMDALILLLVDIAGVTVKDNLSYTVLKSLSLIDFEVTDRPADKIASPKVLTETKLKSTTYRNSTGSSVDSGGGKGAVGDAMMEGLLTSIASRAALGTLLLVTHRCPSFLGIQSWQVMWLLLSLLRDCSLLPACMVLGSSATGDGDLLPAACRTEFEARLLAADRREVDAQLRQHDRADLVPFVKKSSSLLSLQGLGEALFGASPADLAVGGQPSPAYCTVPPRWDVGYEGMASEESSEDGSRATSSTASSEVEVRVASNGKTSNSSAATFTAPSMSIGSSGLNSSVILLGEKSKEGASEYEDVKEVLAAFLNLREMVLACGIAQIVTDTRFFGEHTLSLFFESLVGVTETADGFAALRALNMLAEGITETEGGKEVVKSSSTSCPVSSGLQQCMDGVTDPLLCASSVTFVSPSSVCWLENLLVEASLRNRDRLSLFWALLAQHYELTIQNAVLLTYPLERRITSLFRLSARVISRDMFTHSILELFRLFVPSGKSKRIEGGDADVANSGTKAAETKDTTSSEVVSSSSSSMGLEAGLMHDVSGQVSAGMWRVLTTNLEVLPTLSLSQWQIIFDVIAACASAGGYASIKAFESMAWLLHESRLQGEIPMFCIVGIQPLLCNSRTTISVSVGAVKLLTHLHSRLEVLFTNEDDYVQVDVAESRPAGASDGTGAGGGEDQDQDSDTPLLWESCWTPILSAMAEGCGDLRKPVRLAASNALCAAILDRHVKNVPVGLMVKILGDVYITVTMRLGEFLVKEREQVNALASSGKPPTGKDSVGGSAQSKKATKRKSGVGAAIATESVVLSLPRDSDGPDETKCTVTPLLCTICKVFLDQIKRLSLYPSFDRLWLRLIHLLGYFLGSPYGFDHAVLFPQQLQHTLFSDELHRTVSAAGDHLATLINLLIKSGVFIERPGLWQVTQESLVQMAHRPLDLPLDSPEDLSVSPESLPVS